MSKFQLGGVLDSVQRNRVFALRDRVPLRKRHHPTPLGNVRRSAIPFVAYIDRSCPPPVYRNELRVTREWALGCFLPAYRSARTRLGADPVAIAAEASRVLLLGPPSPAKQELERRMLLATVVLLRQDGIDVPMPEEPMYPEPPTRVHPAWVRALLVGWP